MKILIMLFYSAIILALGFYQYIYIILDKQVDIKYLSPVFHVCMVLLAATIFPITRKIFLRAGKPATWLIGTAAAGAVIYCTVIMSLYVAGEQELPSFADAPSPRTTGGEDVLWMFRQVARYGSPAAHERVGAIYLNGWGTPADPVEARKWFEEAAAEGNADAMRGLAKIYTKGLGTPPDGLEAKRWLEIAGASGDAKSYRMIAELYGSVLPPDSTAKLSAYDKAASLGDVDAAFQLGEIYSQGRETLKDMDKATKYYEMAIAKGDTLSKLNLAVALYNLRERQNAPRVRLLLEEVIRETNENSDYHKIAKRNLEILDRVEQNTR